MRIIPLVLAFLWQQDPLIATTQSAINDAVAAGDLFGIVLQLGDYDAGGRQVVCSLTGSATELSCSRYTLTWENTERTRGRAEHTDPTEYDLDSTTLAALIAAERAWVAASP